MTQPKLGIIAGGGDLPARLRDACAATGRPCFVLAIDGAAQIEGDAVVGLGAVGEAIARLREAGVEEVVMAGGVKRPSLGKLKMDAVGAKAVARLGLKLFAGDDALLKEIVKFLGEHGFRVVGADDVLGGAPVGVMTRLHPDAQAMADIALGLEVAKALGALDVGQAVAVENGYVLAVEAAEGTDALIARAAPLMRESRRAVLVKAKKPQQDARADLPAVGPETVKRARDAGFLGIAYEAGGAIVLDAPEVMRLADEARMFVAGAE